MTGMAEDRERAPEEMSSLLTPQVLLVHDSRSVWSVISAMGVDCGEIIR